MKLRAAIGRLIAASCVALLLSCASTAPPAPDETQAGVALAGIPIETAYAALAKAGSRVMMLDTRESAVRIYVFRGGRASKVGHNHVLGAPRFTGFVSLPDEAPSNARFDLEFRLDELEIDNASWRAGLGKAFESVLSAEAIQGTREHMLGESNMQADKYPLVRISSLGITGEAPHVAAQVRVEMHGQVRDMWVPLAIDGLPNRLEVTGSFVLRQTDFGIAPYSVLGGLIAVRDEVVIEFKLVAH
jgi:polyisoprenoid-binding protein YceI